MVSALNSPAPAVHGRAVSARLVDPWARVALAGLLTLLIIGLITAINLAVGPASHHLVILTDVFAVTEDAVVGVGMALFLAMIPLIFSVLGAWAGGWVTDHLARRGMEIVASRRLPCILGLLASGLCTVVATMASSGIEAVICISGASRLAVAMGVPGGVYPGLNQLNTVGERSHISPRP